MAGELIPLAFRPSVAALSPAENFMQVEQVRQQQLANQLGLDRRAALQTYDSRQQAGDPNAVDALNQQPLEMAQITQSRNAMSTEARTKFDFVTNRRARAAQSVMAHPAGSPERQAAWDSELVDMRRDGTLDQARFNQLYGKPPNEQILKQYTSAARTVGEQDTLNNRDRTREALGGIATSVREAFAPPANSNTARLNTSESGGDFTKMNQLGYVGRQQFGAPRLADMGVYTPGPGENLKGWSTTGRGAPGKWSGEFSIPGFPEVKTVEDFRRNPAAQAAAERIHEQKREGEITANGFDKYVGQTIGRVPVTKDGLMNALHLGGVGSTKRYLQSGGRDDVADQNGTRISDYIRMGARARGAPAAAVQPPAPGAAVAPGGDGTVSPAPGAGTQVAAAPAAVGNDGQPVAVAPVVPSASTPSNPGTVQIGGGVPDPFEKLLPTAMEMMLNPDLPEGARKLGEQIIATSRENSKATEGTKNFLDTNRDRVARGLPELDRMTYESMLGRDRANQMTVDQRSETEIEKKRGAGLGERLNEIAKGGDEAYGQRALVGRLANMLERSGTGADVSFANAARAAFGETIGGLFATKQTLSDAEAADSMINYLKPKMRVAGTGATSDKDLDAFGKAIPSLMSTANGRRMIANTLGGVFQLAIDRSDIATDWQTKKIEAAEAMNKIKTLKDPFESFRDWQGSKDGKAGVAPPDLPTFSTIEEAKAALGSGKLGYSTSKETVRYQLRDGRVGTTPTYEELHGTDR